MEMLTSVWMICILYCTEWLGIRQCFSLPVPTLTNYRQGYYSKNSWSYRQTRYPEIKYEKFVFPNKQQEIMPSLAERSGLEDDSTGKIFFPDEIEIPVSANNKAYEYADREVLPVRKTHHRPSSAISSSHNQWPSLDEMKSLQSSEDGSIRMESPSTQRTQLPLNHPNSEIDDRNSDFESDLRSRLPSSGSTATEEERVQEAIQQFYKWLRMTRNRQKNKQNVPTKCPDQTGSSDVGDTSTTTSTNEASTKPDPFLSDQSLVAGLKELKCPEGEIRLKNGECRLKVAI